MAKLSARGTKFIYDDKVEVNVTYQVGNCKLTDKDLDTLLSLQKVCKENPTATVDCRNKRAQIKIGKAFCMGLTVRGATLFLEGSRQRGEPQRMFYNPKTSTEKKLSYSTYEEAFEQLTKYKKRDFVCIPMCDQTDEKGNCLGHEEE